MSKNTWIWDLVDDVNYNYISDDGSVPMIPFSPLCAGVRSGVGKLILQLFFDPKVYALLIPCLDARFLILSSYECFRES